MDRDAVGVLSPHAVCVSNLPYETTKDVLWSKFSDAGVTVVTVQLVEKGVFSRMKNSGLATVVVSTSSDVVTACRELDGKLLYNRPMIVRKDKFVEDELGYTPAPATAPNAAVSSRGVEAA